MFARRIAPFSIRSATDSTFCCDVSIVTQERPNAPATVAVVPDPANGSSTRSPADLELVAEIVRTVGSNRVKLLFDFYHVQIMHGDVMRRIEENIDIIGHVHVAGNPGRKELDDTQEINFPPLLRKLHALGYQGYVGQEYIPTRDAYEGLREAVALCDI